MKKEQYDKAYQKGYAYLKQIVKSPYYEIVEDTHEYQYGLLLIEYSSEKALRADTGSDPAKDFEISHTCIDLLSFAEQINA